MLSLGCVDAEEQPRNLWRSYLVGAPEIPCAQDSDCLVGTCDLDGCSSLSRTLRFGTREVMLRDIERLRDQCGETCSVQFHQDLEAVFMETPVENAMFMIRLAEALVLHQRPERARELLKEKFRQAKEPETAIYLQIVLARLGDRESREELARVFPCGDPTIDLLFLSAGIAAEVHPTQLCELVGSPNVSSALRALTMVELCKLGEKCPAPESGSSSLRLVDTCAGLGGERSL